MIFHRHGQKGLRTIARNLVEFTRTGKIKALCNIGIGNIDGLGMNRRIGRHQRIVYFAIVAIERQVVELGRNWLASRPAKGDLQRVGTHYFKAQRALILTDAIECSAIGMRNRLGGHENVLQQPVYIRLI